MGNAVTNWDYDTLPAYIEMGYWRGLYDSTTYEKMHDNLCPQEYESIEFRNMRTDPLSKPCKEVLDRFDELTDLINIYDIYGKCYMGPS